MQIIITAVEVKAAVSLFANSADLALESGIYEQEIADRLEDGLDEPAVSAEKKARLEVASLVFKSEEMILAALKAKLARQGVKGAIKAKFLENGDLIIEIDEWAAVEVVRVSQIWLSIFRRPLIQLMKLMYQVGRTLKAFQPGSKHVKEWEGVVKAAAADIKNHYGS